MIHTLTLRPPANTWHLLLHDGFGFARCVWLAAQTKGRLKCITLLQVCDPGVYVAYR
jgi:hypothetical protein